MKINFFTGLFFFFSAGWLYLLMTGCNGPGQGNKPVAGEVSVTDFRGVMVRLDRPATRVICLIESALTGLYMLGAGDLIAGVPADVYRGEVSPWYSRLDQRIMNRSLPAPGNWDFISIENIVALRPDLVVMWASQPESIAAIESKGIPVYAVMLKSFGDVHKEITDLGRLTARERRADSLVRLAGELTAATGEPPAPAKRKRVYFMWAQGPLETSGTTSTVNELLELAGARNVCRLPDEHVVINAEQLVEWDPEVIIMWKNGSLDPADVGALPGWSGLTAVRTGQVYEFPSVFMCDLWTLKYSYAVALVAAWCYPERFPGFQAVETGRQYMETFYGTPILSDR